MRLPPALIAVLFVALAGAGFAAPAQAAPAKPKALLVGAAEDAAREGGPLGADAKMSLASSPGSTRSGSPRSGRPARWRSAAPSVPLQAVGAPPRCTGSALIVSVYPYGSRTAPRYAAARAQFASYAASIPRLVPACGT